MRLLLLVTGEPSPEIAAEHGDYPTLFRRLAAERGAVLEVTDARLGDPDVDGVSGMVITGSAASLVTREPWMDRAVALVRRCHADGVPVLGVCFGHQLIGEAAGGRVIRNPAGWEMSSQSLSLTDAGRRDPLFDGLGDDLEVNFSHQDIIDPETLPGDVMILARNPKARVQALAWGPHIRGVQFHPEFDAGVVRGLIDQRAEELDADARARDVAEDMAERLRARARDSAHGKAVFANFVAMIQRRP